VLSNTEIGAFCSIARNVVIGLVNHPTRFVSTSPVFYDNSQLLPRSFIKTDGYPTEGPKTRIGADVWTGEGVKIMAGINIGVGAVIGAGSIVTKDLPSYAICCGVPCRPIRYRFDRLTCVELEKSRWWNFSDEVLQRVSPSFFDVQKFLELAH